MSDIDDELLALAGGDVFSDEEEASMNMSRGESRSPSRSLSPPPAPPSTKKKDAPVKGVATKKVAAKKAKKRSREEEYSEEEGEASSAPSSPNSLNSAPMDESDSDDDAPPSKSLNDDENKYPVDGMFMSHAERAEIMNMREVERETILAERAQEKERLMQNKLLRQLVSNEEQRSKKRSATTADLEENQRKTTRIRTKIGGTKVGETNSALDELKTRRAEKSERNRRRVEDRERRKDRSPSYRDDRSPDRDDHSDVEWAAATKSKPKSRSPEIKDTSPADIGDAERVRLGRSRFSQVCFFPGFNETITGCFVRIAVGPDPDRRGENIYRVGIVKGFTTGRAYAFSGLQGQQLVTDQYVLAAHGKTPREWPFIACSDHRITEGEWTRYVRVCQADGVALPTRPALVKKCEAIDALLARSWTTEELNTKIARQNELKFRFNGIRRKQLENAVTDAHKAHDDDAAAAAQDELDKLGTPRLAFRTSLAPPPSSASKPASGASTPTGGGGSGAAGAGTPSQQERLAAINAENRRKNADEVRRAQLRDRQRARVLEKKLERGEAVANEDTSRRLKTRAKFVHDVHEARERRPAGSGANSGASTPAQGTPRLGAANTSAKQPLLPHVAKLLKEQNKAVDKNGLPTIHKPLMDDDIIAALDLDIDENILD